MCACVCVCACVRACVRACVCVSVYIYSCYNIIYIKMLFFVDVDSFLKKGLLFSKDALNRSKVTFTMYNVTKYFYLK